MIYTNNKLASLNPSGAKLRYYHQFENEPVVLIATMRGCYFLRLVKVCLDRNSLVQGSEKTGLKLKLYRDLFLPHEILVER